MGLYLERQPPAPFEVWPENWQAAELFGRMQRQWNVGPRGPLGLRYEALPVPMRMLGIADDDLDTFDALRVMEGAALEWYEQRRT